jgi:hypothetical protein
MIFLGQESLVRAIAEYAAHYHEERSHQGIGNEMISGAKSQGEGVIETRERLGGLLKYHPPAGGVRWAASVLYSDTTRFIELLER